MSDVAGGVSSVGPSPQPVGSDALWVDSDRMELTGGVETHTPELESESYHGTPRHHDVATVSRPHCVFANPQAFAQALPSTACALPHVSVGHRHPLQRDSAFVCPASAPVNRPCSSSGTFSPYS